ncbi:hypothetical protein J6O48_10365 [bacterium]|nr:hypothetical protein [bacterium]
MSLTSKLTIGALRQLVPQKQAWRELLGREEFLKLYKCFKNSEYYSNGGWIEREKSILGFKFSDSLHGKCVTIFPQTKGRDFIHSVKTFYGKEINMSSMQREVDLFERNIPILKSTPKSSDCLEPKMLKKLFSDKYKSTRRFNEEGYPVTTIIDRKTQKPVEAYIKKGKIPCSNGTYNEGYEMYVKMPDGNSVLVGKRSFPVDTVAKQISSGNMASYARELYEGIGTRLHQLAVERAIQNNYNSIHIGSTGDAFPFHYKSLFRAEPFAEYVKMTYDDVLRIGKLKGLNDNEIKECLVESVQKGLYDSKTLENILKKAYIKNEDYIAEFDMVLDGQNFEYWKKLAKTQPILLE